jgi:hypothetical protein
MRAVSISNFPGVFAMNLQLCCDTCRPFLNSRITPYPTNLAVCPAWRLFSVDLAVYLE